MKITIESIPHEKQRYDTVGDWQFHPNGDITIFVSVLPDFKAMQLIAVHELIEAIECWHAGVDEKAVDNFDKSYKGPFDEPGMDPHAPYHRQHLDATVVEMILARALDVDWPTYEQFINALIP